MLNTGSNPLASNHRLLTTVAYRIAGQTTYALEGSIFIAGAAVQWLRDKLKIIDNAAQSEVIARSGSQRPAASIWFPPLPVWAPPIGTQKHAVPSLA